MRHAKRVAMWTMLGVVLVSGVAVAQSGGANAPPPCSQPECRQFDFWIGEWDVTNPQGNPAGTNSIRRVLGGCALQENWTSANGQFAGNSYNIYDAASGRWHQTWVDNSGTLLLLDGGFVNGKMVLTGSRPPAKPGAIDVFHRISWEPKSEDEVRQLWETSADGGQTWSIAFDGTYRRKK